MGVGAGMSGVADPLEDAAFVRIRRALIQRTGHSYYADKDRALRDRLRLRMAATGTARMDRYAALLDGPEGEAEWRALEDEITIGETYFFRYPDHFQALRTRLLPDLLARRQAVKRLRIWSIGCANGAEPYSVAILLHELLGDAIADWRISLVGGDISERALAAACRARYGQWALRTLGPEQRARYFTCVEGKLWTLRSQYRRLVRFERQNLLDLLSPAPPLQWNEFDLILCRNLLIYFDPQTAQAAVSALRSRLAEGGTMLLGHAEATLVDGAALMTVADAIPAGSAAPMPILPVPFASPPLHLPLGLSVGPAIPPVAPVAPVGALDDGLERLRRLADAGEDDAARALCNALLEAHPTVAALHYYDAILHHGSGDAVAAEAGLRRALYLDRGFVLAHHRLGLLLLGTGRRDAGRRALTAALRLAAALPCDASLAEGDDIEAGRFATQLRVQIDRLHRERAA